MLCAEQNRRTPVERNSPDDPDLVSLSLFKPPVLILQTKTLAALPAKHGPEKLRLIRERCFGALVWSLESEVRRGVIRDDKNGKKPHYKIHNNRFFVYLEAAEAVLSNRHLNPPTLQVQISK